MTWDLAAVAVGTVFHVLVWILAILLTLALVFDEVTGGEDGYAFELDEEELQSYRRGRLIVILLAIFCWVMLIAGWA